MTHMLYDVLTTADVDFLHKMLKILYDDRVLFSEDEQSASALEYQIYYPVWHSMGKPENSNAFDK